jgi:hypothetical protein
LKYFFLGDEGEPPFRSEHAVSVRADECFQTLRNALMVAVIDLQADDDPQVIFETLNARGEPLLPADLLRNYIFFRASRAGLDIEAAYQKYWSRFDEEFWREEVKQGRLVRPRSDLFMQHFLASRQGRDIPIKHLYVEYRHWIDTAHPFNNVTEELAMLARQGDAFRRIIAPKPDDVVFGFCSFLEVFDIRTAYPLLLALIDVGLDESNWPQFSSVLESYLLRRAVGNLSTKNYNRIFLALVRNLRNDGFSASRLSELLAAQTGDSGIWPDDAAFHEAWLHKPLYGVLNSPKLVYIYTRLNQTFMSSKSENLAFNQAPTIEHIMPRAWEDNWPLSDGSKGMDIKELIEAHPNDPRADMTRRREEAVQTLGNLTLLSSALNSSQSNLAWEYKRPEMAKHSLLPINQDVLTAAAWNEDTILKRGESLFSRAIKIWPR